MKELRKLTPNEANELRCTASEIIIRLFEAGERDQLQLLHVTAQEAMRQIEEGGLHEKRSEKI